MVTARKWVGVCAALTALGVTAACGGDETSEDRTGSASGEPILIGSIGEYSKAPAATPELAVGVQAAVRAINAEGGVQGRPLELIACDTEDDPNRSAQCGRTMVDKGVVAVVGSYGTRTDGYMPILEDAGIPVVGSVPVAGSDLTSPINFPLTGGTPVVLGALPALLERQDVSKASFGYLEFAGGPAYVEYFTSGIERGPLDMGASVAVPGGSPDVSPYAAALTADGTDGVAIATGQAEAVKLVKALRQSGFDGPIALAGAGATSQESLAALGDDAEGLVSLFPCKPPTFTDDPDVKRFADDMEAEDPEARKSFSSQVGWAATYLFKHVADGLDKVEPQALLEALPNVKDFESGVCAPVTFGEEGTLIDGMPRVFNDQFVFAKVTDGEWVPDGDGSFVSTLS